MPNKNRASALLLTTILLFVIISMVVSLSSFTVMEQKMSQKTKSSTRAFYNSESGIEWVLNKIATSSATDINTAFGVSDPSNGINCPAFMGGADNCKVFLLSSEGKVITNGTLSLSEVKAVRSVGTQNQETQRAIEAAVAGSGGGCYISNKAGCIGDACCLTGFANKGSAGQWGYCWTYDTGSYNGHNFPPGGNCIGGFGNRAVGGESFVCCQS